jgi:hypothetical protein
MTGPVSSSDYHMGTKEQLERGGFAFALTDTRLFVSQGTLVTSGKSSEDVSGCHQVLRDVDSKSRCQSAWTSRVKSRESGIGEGNQFSICHR